MRSDFFFLQIQISFKSREHTWDDSLAEAFNFLLHLLFKGCQTISFSTYVNPYLPWTTSCHSLWPCSFTKKDLGEFICFPWGVLTIFWCGLQRKERHQWLATSVSRLQVSQHSSGPSIPAPLSFPSASRPPYFRGGRAEWNSDLWKSVRDSCEKEPTEQTPYTMCVFLCSASGLTCGALLS